MTSNWTRRWLGEHNAEVLREYLGYSEERVAELEAQGVLQRAPI
jgi:crotonobetainyl-CoA:carnitine CoA-transferase CaiB-like acyl-CoA transferase